MEPHEIVAAAVGTLTLGTAATKYVVYPAYLKATTIIKSHLEVVPLVKKIAAEFEPNCGGSMRDSVNRIEASVYRLTQVDHIAMEMSDKSYIELDADAQCTWANSAFAKLTGLQRHDIYGNGWINGILAADRAAVRSEFSQAIADRRNFTIQFRLQTNICVYLTALLVMDRSGATAGAIASIGSLDCHSCPTAWKEACHNAKRK